VPGGEKYQSTKAETEAIHTALKDLLPAKEADRAKRAEDLGYKTLPLATDNAYTLFKGKTTPEETSGYQGRMGLYEVFEVTEAIQDQILKHATSSAIQKVAQQEGMVSMRQDGYLKALDGHTTIMEVDRVASSEA
jgi:type II secretory ATPase GspE/PulE/Tfp pilus assembly ATPase PilB-like protein